MLPYNSTEPSQEPEQAPQGEAATGSVAEPVAEALPPIGINLPGFRRREENHDYVMSAQSADFAADAYTADHLDRQAGIRR